MESDTRIEGSNWQKALFFKLPLFIVNPVSYQLDPGIPIDVWGLLAQGTGEARH